MIIKHRHPATFMNRWRSYTILLLTPALLTISACNESGNYAMRTPLPSLPDDRPPAIVATNPSDGENGVSPGRDIVVQFDEAIAEGQDTSSAMTVNGPDGPVPGEISVQTSKLRFHALSGLQFDKQYHVELQAGIADRAGNRTTSGRGWKFETLNPRCPDESQNALALLEGQLITKPAPNLAKPSKSDRYTDPAHGTCVVRATDHETEPPSGFARNDYSRRQAFNANDSMFLIYAYDGFWHLYDARDLSYIRRLDMGGSEVEPQWHPENPELLYILEHNGGMTIRQYNVLTDAMRVIADFRDVTSIAGHPGKTDVRDIWPDAERIWTKSEGSPSADARYWGFMVDTEDFQGLGLMTYDLQTNTITGVYDYITDGNGIGRPDHVSMSPSGEYIVASWYIQDCKGRFLLGSLNNPCGLMSYQRDFTSARGLATRGEHSDIALDANGNDVVVMPNYDSGYVEAYTLESGTSTRLWNIYINGSATAMHISGKSFGKPGWALISTYGTKNPRGVSLWYEDKIFAVELKSNPRIFNIAHTYDLVDQYFSEPHAVVNRDFTRILFNSNWNSGNFRDIDAYLITLPASSIPSN